jgi:cytochrome c oxidase subunit 3
MTKPPTVPPAPTEKHRLGAGGGSNFGSHDDSGGDSGGGGGDGDDGDSSGDDAAPRPRGPTGTPPDASTFGLKIFLFSLTTLFGATILAYVITRVQADTWDDVEFEGLRGGLVASTVLLLLVSAALHYALHSIRYDHRDRLKLGLVLAAILASLFLVNQADSWFELRERITSQRRSVGLGEAGDGDLSVFLFYAMTVLHALHVLGGFVPLFWTLKNAFQDLYSGASFRGVYNCVLYWHFIDIVWLLIAIAFFVG